MKYVKGQKITNKELEENIFPHVKKNSLIPITLCPNDLGYMTTIVKANCIEFNYNKISVLNPYKDKKHEVCLYNPISNIRVVGAVDKLELCMDLYNDKGDLLGDIFVTFSKNSFKKGNDIFSKTLEEK